MIVISLFNPFVSLESKDLVQEVLNSGYIAQGPMVDRFEQALEDYFNVDKRVVTLNSCTSAIELALHMIKTEYNLPDGTEVLTTPVTCFATNAPIIHNRMNIKWCDVDKNTLNIDFNDVISRVTKNTRILMVVHWGGHAVNYDELDILKEYYKHRFNQELYVVEDCAHAFGAWFGNREKYGRVGFINDDHFSCFSFQAIKTLTTGDGGMLVTPPNLYKKARLLRWFGLDRDNKVDFRHCQDIKECGFKLHMNDIAAAIGVGNLKHVTPILVHNAHIAYDYNDHINKELLLWNDPESDSSWLYTIVVDDNKKFTKYMTENGIQVNMVHSRNDQFSVFSKFKTDTLPVVDQLESKRICIPIGPHISDSNKYYIIEKVNQYNDKFHS